MNLFRQWFTTIGSPKYWSPMRGILSRVISRPELYGYVLKCGDIVRPQLISDCPDTSKDSDVDHERCCCCFPSRISSSEQHCHHSWSHLWCFISACAHCCSRLPHHEDASQPPWLWRVSVPSCFFPHTHAHAHTLSPRKDTVTDTTAQTDTLLSPFFSSYHYESIHF